MTENPLVDPAVIKLWKKVLADMQEDKFDEDEIRLMKDIIKEAERDWDEYHDRETYRQESQWDPAYIYDLTHLRDPNDDGLSDDPYDTMYE